VSTLRVFPLQAERGPHDGFVVAEVVHLHPGAVAGLVVGVEEPSCGLRIGHVEDGGAHHHRLPLTGPQLGWAVQLGHVLEEVLRLGGVEEIEQRGLRARCHGEQPADELVGHAVGDHPGAHQAEDPGLGREAALPHVEAVAGAQSRTLSPSPGWVSRIS
jgi:hypothetical protein